MFLELGTSDLCKMYALILINKIPAIKRVGPLIVATIYVFTTDTK